MKFTIAQYEAIQKKASLLRERLQQEPTHAVLSATAVSFYKADVEIGSVNLHSQRGWIQEKHGGSQAVQL
jgi:hypothetical protein